MPRKVFLLLMCVGFCALAQALQARFNTSRRQDGRGGERALALLESFRQHFREDRRIVTEPFTDPAGQFVFSAPQSSRQDVPRLRASTSSSTREKSVGSLAAWPPASPLSARNIPGPVLESPPTFASGSDSADPIGLSPSPILGEGELTLQPPANFPDESLSRSAPLPLPIVGVWKDTNSRIQFRADGEVVVQEASHAEGPGGPEIRRPAGAAEQILKGRFQAREDILSVSWEDGPKTNYRWRLQDGWLLLTSHHGRNYLLHRNSEEERDSHAR